LADAVSAGSGISFGPATTAPTPPKTGGDDGFALLLQAETSAIAAAATQPCSPNMTVWRNRARIELEV
jgi:hypothetical protein